MEPLRRAIADYVNLERGAHATPDRVLVLTSSQQAMTLCATVLLDAGDRIFIEDPAYHGRAELPDAAGLECVPVPLDAHGMRVEHLLNAVQPAKAVFLTLAPIPDGGDAGAGPAARGHRMGKATPGLDHRR